MSNESRVSSKAPNRRASRRLALRDSLKIECRKGGTGLGPNLAVGARDLSETGVNLVVTLALEKGQEVEILINIQGGQVAKRLANVVWSVPLGDGTHDVGLDFQTNLSFADYQRATQLPRIIS